MIAVNISDCNKDFIVSTFLLKPVLSNKIVNAEKDRIDGDALVLNCDDEKAKTIVEIVRKKYSKNLFRFYQSNRGKAWKRL